MLEIVTAVSKWAIPVFLALVLVAGVLRGVRVFEAFVEGAEQGFGMAVKLIPFLVAMIVAISVFRASGAMDIFVGAVALLLSCLSVPPDTAPRPHASPVRKRRPGHRQ
jgi:spore maturation protein B